MKICQGTIHPYAAAQTKLYIVYNSINTSHIYMYANNICNNEFKDFIITSLFWWKLETLKEKRDFVIGTVTLLFAP
mgnify:CR=1 FL=1